MTRVINKGRIVIVIINSSKGRKLSCTTPLVSVNNKTKKNKNKNKNKKFPGHKITPFRQLVFNRHFLILVAPVEALVQLRSVWPYCSMSSSW